MSTMCFGRRLCCITSMRVRHILWHVKQLCSESSCSPS
jgi:hypothetical protein